MGGGKKATVPTEDRYPKKGQPGRRQKAKAAKAKKKKKGGR